MTEWTDERKAKLRRLWPRNNARTCAEKLGGFEHTKDGGKNAVIGQADRMGLKRKRKPYYTHGRTRRPRAA